jgi:tRNA pseudouridine55 synthase
LIPSLTGAKQAVASHTLDGVLLLDKPVGITSNGALQRLKRLFGAAKAGHVGTLDPLATGLLPVCFGESTKFSSGTFGADKVYEADIALGVTTTTGDSEGEVISRLPVSVGQVDVEAALQGFVGLIEQTPPMYSALKRGGKPLYVYARRGEKVEVEPRSVTVHEIRILGFHGARLQCRIACGSGTYIRVLAEDIGRALGCGGSLAALRRTALGDFSVSAAVTFERLEAVLAEERLAFVLPVDGLLSRLPKLMLAPEDARRVLAGGACRLRDQQLTGALRLYSDCGRFLGIAEALPSGDVVPRRLIASAPGPRQTATCSIA